MLGFVEIIPADEVFAPYAESVTYLQTNPELLRTLNISTRAYAQNTIVMRKNQLRSA